MQQIITASADEVVLKTGFVKRNRKLIGSLFVETPVLSWLETLSF